MSDQNLPHHISAFMSLLLLCCMLFLSREVALYVNGSAAAPKSFTVVIDSGHGGIDPGKIAADGTLEKDINLSIALKLQKYLEAADVTVVMTRTTDDGLYDTDASNKKVQDLKNRVALIEASTPDIAISIHQNSYSDPSIQGAQVFYYTTGNAGKALAESLQNILIKQLDPANHRKAKANDSYYLLKKTSCPIVIVECGFLSSPEEAALLKSDAYQEEIAWAIHLGILQYLNGSAGS